MNPNNQYTVKSTEYNWVVNYCTILDNTNYCVALSHKESKESSKVSSRISFVKYPFECFISQETIAEELIYCCYNPKNTIELIVCGKGYLRLWNVFINEGSLKEHQQRFLRGKQEKEHTFIKAQFFTKKPFLLIVGTLENMFYIIDSFQVLYQLNVCYCDENIYDLNVQNLQNIEENDDIGNLKENIDSLTKNDLDSKLKKISNLTSEPIRKKEYIQNNYRNKMNSSEILGNNNNLNDNIQKKNFSVINDKDDVFNRLYRSKRTEEKNAKLNKTNTVRFFELINDNLLFVIYADDGCCLLYKIDWNRKMLDGESEEDFRKWKCEENRIIRIARNVKSIFGYSMYKPKNDIILIVESFDLENKHKSNICLFKMKKINVKEKENEMSNMLNFEHDVFSGYFDNTPIKLMDLCEKQQLVYYVDEKNSLKCFDILKNKYIITHYFQEKIRSISVNSGNNLFAVSFENKVTVFGKLKEKIVNYCDLEVSDSIVKWSSKGDLLVICGLNRNPNKSKSYCLYFIETEKFNTVNVFENLKMKFVDMKFVDDDRYLFCLADDSYIMGIYLNIYCDSKAFDEIYEETGREAIVANKFKVIFTHNARGKNYSEIDYDPNLEVVLAIAEQKNKMYIYSNKSEKKLNTNINNINANNTISNNRNTPNAINIEINCNLCSINIVKDLHILIGGNSMGNLNIYRWPLKGFENKEIKNINDSLLSYINLDLGYISQLLNFKNYSKLITLTSNSHIFVNELLVQKPGDTYLPFEYFQKQTKPQVEIVTQPYDLYDAELSNIVKKEVNVYILNKAMEKLKIVMDEDMEEIQKNNYMEIDNMENNINQNMENEEIKLSKIIHEIDLLSTDMKLDTQKRIQEMNDTITSSKEKYEGKIDLYDHEIERLKNELKDIKNSIEEKYESEANNQKEFYDKLLGDYNEKFNKLKTDTKKSLEKLVNLGCEYDEANDKIIQDYEKLLKNLQEKINLTAEKNEKILDEEREKLKKAEELEKTHKAKLEEKVKESDKLIEKNVEIKQSIINVTQRTITFQEQLLETEKNLVKIDKKLEDLVVKNKHLEQIRFVLEHRMTSLEKEKAPLEGQCAFLENQKNKLTEEFNKIILQINKNNQELENKQSQLRASLIQNYEIHDQKNYVEAKLIQLKSDIEQFFMNYQDSDDEKSLSENKATSVALNFKRFYDKYFSIPIDDELLDYQRYAQKLQEQTDKDGIANNFDLIMRNKAEEKLACEKAKVDELIDAKERGFHRIQNENTILITECNRLRKNLHEIYMHVIDIEQRFEALTNINPKFSKSQIVGQIKEFIRITHEKIKENYSQTKNDLMKGNRKLMKKTNTTMQNKKNLVINTDNNNEENEKVANTENNEYANVIKLPGIKTSQNSSMYNYTSANVNRKNIDEKLPVIGK